MHNTITPQSGGRPRRFVRAAVTLVGVGTMALGAMTGTANGLSAQAGADISNVSFSAVDASTYDHATGGGIWGDGTTNLVSQLNGADFSCGDYASFLFLLEVSPTPVAPNSTARVVLTFTADSTGQSGAALVVDDTSTDHVRVNSSAVDSAVTGDDGSAIVNATASSTGPRFVGGSNEVLTIDVTDLEASENVVVRTDVRIACDPLSTPTGNLQATLTSIDIVAPGDPGAVSGGNQTVNLQGVGDINGADEALLRVSKTLTTTDGTCPGVESLSVDVTTDAQVLACISIENYGTRPAYDMVVTDDSFTSGDATDDVTVEIVGLTDEDDDGTADDLAPGEFVGGSALVTVPGEGDFTNSVLVTADDNAAVTYTSTDTADVAASLSPVTTRALDLPLTGARSAGRTTEAALVLVALGVGLLLSIRLLPRRLSGR